MENWIPKHKHTSTWYFAQEHATFATQAFAFRLQFHYFCFFFLLGKCTKVPNISHRCFLYHVTCMDFSVRCIVLVDTIKQMKMKFRSQLLVNAHSKRIAHSDHLNNGHSFAMRKIILVLQGNSWMETKLVKVCLTFETHTCTKSEYLSCGLNYYTYRC